MLVITETPMLGMVGTGRDKDVSGARGRVAKGKVAKGKARARDESAPELHWQLKRIEFNGARRTILVDGADGACSLPAICNILSLRGHIDLGERTGISYAHLRELLAEHILLSSSGADAETDAALGGIADLIQGVAFNPVFTFPTAFRPRADTLGARALLARAGITLVHGLLADPDEPVYAALMRARDYDAAVRTSDAHAGDSYVHSRVSNGHAGGSGSPSNSGPNTPEQKTAEDATLLRAWLAAARAQLPDAGLFALGASGADKSDGLCALFRGAHLAVLLRRPDGLYALVTDASFAHDARVVWERLADAEHQACAGYVDAAFQTSSVWTAGHDEALAWQIQGEEDEAARVRFEKRNRYVQRQEEQLEKIKKREEKKRRKMSGCVVM